MDDTDTCAFCGAPNPTRIVIMEPKNELIDGHVELTKVISESSCDDCSSKTFLELLRARAAL